MSTMDIFNLDESLKEYINETNKEDLDVIIDEFKQSRFQNVLSKTKVFREKHETNKRLARILSLLDAACHSQIDEEKQAADIIRNMYQDSNENSIDDIILYGSLAFMCDYKLARKIMSDAVKRIQNEEAFDQMKAARAYLVLGETEENLKKFVRAIKYYKQGLTYIQKEINTDNQMVLYLHFKLGALHSLINETDEAIAYLQKTLELADDANTEIKINSLVSMAKMVGSKNEYEKAIAYLKEAIPMFDGSSLANKFVHAEAYTELAYNYFVQSQYDEAVPYYENAITLHLKIPNYSARELGMIYMQYAYCVDHKEDPDKLLAGRNYEKAFEQLEKSNDQELLKDALADIIVFFDSTGNKKKKHFYESKFVKLTNEKAHVH
ncbi:lipopolysaccharide assembly protein LapB [Neobacillus mesonae]|uniref:tetratricopeptide repeat protein n=1 Tax=Neobacillus mesonae TaxID=1193713 RepID=UPI00204039AC|nr:tetratricopeptide repeat protein [Neobacillus mesonae]MCM3569275.1 tetratricopeptide repeat protein [Neobacillus mesonae]